MTLTCPMPGCDVFPYDRPEDLAAHLVSHTGQPVVEQSPPLATPAPKGTDPAPTGTGRFQTETNGFGGTTTVKAQPVHHDVTEIRWPEGRDEFARLVVEHFADRKFADIDVTANLKDLALNWLARWDGDFEYLVDMKHNVATRGSLSVGQTRGVLNCMRAEALREARKAPCDSDAQGNPLPAPAEPITGIDLRKLPESAHGRLHVAVPDHTTGDLVFLVIAQRRSGKVVVLQEVGGNEDLYLGQQFDGQAYRGKRVAELEAVLADPQAAVTAYGLHFTRCGICSTQLTDPVSIERGVGPKCAQKVGW